LTKTNYYAPKQVEGWDDHSFTVSQVLTPAMSSPILLTRLDFDKTSVISDENYEIGESSEKYTLLVSKLTGTFSYIGVKTLTETQVFKVDMSAKTSSKLSLNSQFDVFSFSFQFSSDLDFYFAGKFKVLTDSADTTKSISGLAKDVGFVMHSNPPAGENCQTV
jgi:hypothetical protein